MQDGSLIPFCPLLRILVCFLCALLRSDQSKHKSTVEDKREHKKTGFLVKKKPLDRIAEGSKKSMVVGEGFEPSKA